jgi:hypothetical protein
MASSRPVTEARLPSALEIKLMQPVSLQLGTGFVIDYPQGITLGTISKLTRNQRREVKRRYSLGKHAYEPYDIIPGKITTELSLEKVVLYSEYVASTIPSNVIERMIGQIASTTLNIISGQTLAASKTLTLSDGDMLGALGYVSGNLLFQQVPFAIQEIVYPPEDFSDKQPTITTYYDCWLTTNPISYDIHDRDQLILQECNVAVGKVTTSIPFEKAIVPLIRRLLPQSLKIGL